MLAQDRGHYRSRTHPSVMPFRYVSYTGISLPLPYQPSSQSTCLRIRKSPVAPLLSQLLFQLLDATLSHPGP